MISSRWGLSVLAAILAGGLPLFGPVLPARAAASAPKTASLELYPERQHADDLEIGGDLAGVPHGQTRFVSYADLLKLPQVNVTVTGDENFDHPVQVSGVLLERLPALLGAEPDAHMVSAICDDHYEAHYTAEYLAAHHPILVLKLEGQDHAHWPIGVDKLPLGPYMISHERFAPAHTVLAHKEQPQVPWGVLRLDLRREADVYRPIQPKGTAADEALVKQGYVIARENCFRCHANGGEGGTKSKFQWDTLARMAVRRPEWFAQYVRDPKSINPKTEMAASPEFDDATMTALRAYFAAFAAPAAPTPNASTQGK